MGKDLCDLVSWITAIQNTLRQIQTSYNLHNVSHNGPAHNCQTLSRTKPLQTKLSNAYFFFLPIHPHLYCLLKIFQWFIFLKGKKKKSKLTDIEDSFNFHQNFPFTLTDIPSKWQKQSTGIPWRHCVWIQSNLNAASIITIKQGTQIFRFLSAYKSMSMLNCSVSQLCNSIMP